MNGVKGHAVPQAGKLVVTFDDGKTSVEAIGKALKDGGYPVAGKPVYVKPVAKTRPPT